MLKPLGARIVVKRDDPRKDTTGGILLPDRATEKPVSGLVLAVGSGSIAKDTGVHTPITGVTVGSRVMFKTWGGEDVPPALTDGHEGCIVINIDDVWGVIL